MFHPSNIPYLLQLRRVDSVLYFSEFELKRIRVFCDDITSHSLHAELICNVLGFGYRIEGLSVIFYESVSGKEQADSNKYVDLIRADFNHLCSNWKISFRNCNGDWSIYQPLPTVDRFEFFTAEIDFFITNRLILIASQ